MELLEDYQNELPNDLRKKNSRRTPRNNLEDSESKILEQEETLGGNAVENPGEIPRTDNRES